MFKLEPFYDYDSQKIELPKGMFQMEKIIGNERVALPGQSDMGALDVKELLRRQDRMFEELAAIEGQVKALETKYGIETPSASPAKLASGSGAATAVVGDVIHDIVIYANPASPPYSLIYLYTWIREQYTCRTSVHQHSSVQSIPEKLLKCFGNGVCVERPSAQIALTLIWKDVKHGPEMRVNPSSQTPICGEANIARYVARMLNPGYLSDLERASLADQWLDLASFTLIGGNSKERAAAIRTLNSHLGKESWLVGEGVSFVDAVLYSVLQQTGHCSGASGNVKNWLKACETLEPFRQISALAA